MLRRNTLPLVPLAMLVTGSEAAAHYTYILPQSFTVAAGDTVVIGFHSGDGFPESTAILKRLQEPAIRGDRGVMRIDGLKEDGKRLAASVTVPATRCRSSARPTRRGVSACRSAAGNGGSTRFSWSVSARPMSIGRASGRR